MSKLSTENNLLKHILLLFDSLKFMRFTIGIFNTVSIFTIEDVYFFYISKDTPTILHMCTDFRCLVRLLLCEAW